MEPMTPAETRVGAASTADQLSPREVERRKSRQPLPAAGPWQPHCEGYSSRMLRITVPPCSVARLGSGLKLTIPWKSPTVDSPGSNVAARAMLRQLSQVGTPGSGGASNLREVSRK